MYSSLPKKELSCSIIWQDLWNRKGQPAILSATLPLLIPAGGLQFYQFQ